MFIFKWRVICCDRRGQLNSLTSKLKPLYLDKHPSELAKEEVMEKHGEDGTADGLIY